ncbi:4'-phosphopantetheinyl transferase superfamily protein [Flavobacterium sp. C3NV]|uniref:4'-phosphopantetheinyl transferase family protein n=1 Tax=Flavobacterium sp. C3NV TaxID=3393358 RepID=UPI0039900668
MIGNDVIDMMQSRKESNWQRKGFVEKLFTASEQLLISKTSDPEMIVWLLWSMKEAAYKIYNRQTKIRKYIPHKLACTIISKNEHHVTGIVNCPDYTYYTKTTISKDSLHTVAVMHAKHLDHVIEIEKKNIIKDENGIPFLTTLSSNVLKDVSISHHGRFQKVVIINHK